MVMMTVLKSIFFIEVDDNLVRIFHEIHTKLEKEDCLASKQANL